MRKLLTILFALVLFTPAFTQELILKLNKSEFEIGEPIELKLWLQHNNATDSISHQVLGKEFSGVTLSKKPDNEKGDLLPNDYTFEQTAPFKDSSFTLDNQLVWQGTYTITAWDSAMVFLPVFEVSLNDSIYKTQAELINITNPRTAQDKEFYDIIEQQTELPSTSGFWYYISKNWVWILTLLSILIGLIIGLAQKNNGILNRKSKPLLSPKDEALQALENLKNSDLLHSDVKEYYFSISSIIRKFLTRSFKENYQEKTTNEIHSLLKSKNIDITIVDWVKETLSESDMVKFAKFKPSTDQTEKVLEIAKRIILKIEQLLKTEE